MYLRRHSQQKVLHQGAAAPGEGRSRDGVHPNDVDGKKRERGFFPHALSNLRDRRRTESVRRVGATVRFQDPPSASSWERRLLVRSTQDLSRSAPMKRQPSLRAAGAMLARPRRTGSHTTCPGRAKRSMNSAIPAWSRRDWGSSPPGPSGGGSAITSSPPSSRKRLFPYTSSGLRRRLTRWGDPILDRGSVLPVVEPAVPPQFRVCQMPEHLRQVLRSAHHHHHAPGPEGVGRKGGEVGWGTQGTRRHGAGG